MLASKTKSRIIWVFLFILAVGLWASKVGDDSLKWVRTTFFEVKQSERVPVYQKFYRVKVNVTVDKKEPVLVDFVLGCRTRLRVPKSDWSMIRYVRVPLVFGVRTKGGQGVLVEGPVVCNADLKNYVPDNYLPAIFFAPDADDLEHMTAYLTERAYNQPISRLTFHKATIEEVDKQYFENWKATAPPNIVPFMKNNRRGFFAGGNYPKGDSRSRSAVRCNYALRIPFSETFREEIRSWWPEDRPKYWVPKKEHVWRLIKIQKEIRNDLQKAYFVRYRGREKSGNPFSGVQKDRAYGWGEPNGNARMGYGIRRPSGGGALYSIKSQMGVASFIPYHTDLVQSPYRLNEPLETMGYYLKVENGADQGFGNCQRGDSVAFLKYSKPTNVKMFIDGKLVGSVETDYPQSDDLPLIERDEFFFRAAGSYGFTNTEFGNQQ